MSNDLALLKEKIRQLPPNLIVEVDSFVNELLKQHNIEIEKSLKDDTPLERGMRRETIL